ncbi:MAG: dipeptidase [Deltaproteobacteria bacterium]|nr:dipeptidase [Deltaproteobacteria bacterium]
MRRWLLALAALVVAGCVGLVAFGPGLIENARQGVLPHTPYAIGAKAAALHDSLIVADWHADSLLWGRDLLQRSSRGHVDLPRLREGNVAIQMFTIVSKSPRGQNYERNSSASGDNITPLVMIQAWPPRTWRSLLERALYQSEKLHVLAERAPEQIRIVRTAVDLEAALALRSGRPAGERPVAALLGIEGAHALDGRAENVDALYDAGFRMIGLHHFFDSRLGGSLHGESGEGLTEFGREVVRRLENRRIIIDLAHSSPAVVDDVLAMASRPVVVSHTGMQGTCDSPRNLSDAQMRRIADAGGLVAIGYWDGAICDVTPEGVVRTLRYAIDTLGVEHVALGSDYDGSTWTMFDTSELAVLTETMLRQGFTPAEIQAVMGGNSARFLLEQLPRS